MPRPRTIGEVTRVEINVIGARNFPILSVKLPIDLVRDLPDLILNAQLIEPALEPEHVIRSIWRRGSSFVSNIIRAGGKLPLPKVEPVPDPPERAIAPESRGD